jgi:protein involved in polysaccharide export with SLBB domain
MKRALVVMLPAMLPALLAGCASVHPSKDVVGLPQATGGAPQPQVSVSEGRYRKEYILAPEDQIEVVVQRAPEVSRTVLIRPDGAISLPLVGEMPAGGLTPRELTEKLTASLSRRMLEPEVTVIVARFRQPTVYVTGAVEGPAAVPLKDAPTAMEAIARAGGLKHTAAYHDIVVIRLAPDGRVQAIRMPVDIGGQPGGYMATRLLRLEPDDLVFVPENGRTQLGRGITELVTTPLTAINALLWPYVNYRLLEMWDDDQRRD